MVALLLLALYFSSIEAWADHSVPKVRALINRAYTPAISARVNPAGYTNFT
jgi:hypothetical protein